mgnify:CR=1 FL=1
MSEAKATIKSPGSAPVLLGDALDAALRWKGRPKSQRCSRRSAPTLDLGQFDNFGWHHKRGCRQEQYYLQTFHILDATTRQQKS